MTGTIMFYDGDRAYIATRDEFGVHQLETLRIHPGRYVKIDDSKRRNPQYPQLCAGATFGGATIVAAEKEADIARQLARDCRARLVKKRQTYDRFVGAEMVS